MQGAGYDYFPVETGRYIEYEINEVRYNVTSPVPARTTYFLREVYGQSFPGSTGIEQFPVQRYKKPRPEASWTLDSVWTAYRIPDRAVRVENNVAFVKLAFPLTDQSTWNGNMLNARVPESYQVQFDAPFPARNDFPKSLSVVQRRDSSLVSVNKRIEVYAPGVGLVYREDTSLEYCQETNCIGSGKIDTGISRITTISKYGKE
ncbi:hypothetical protein [Persicitalea jodogahamensis]|uniref:Uncharacterized protein n=1 Tax=Persicitalea jodogahamensis TaxID=402147 RepID=A0A8J3D4J7_9BACT|nr:hypothetical protein [Persicitalea jodogahamensis]GHB73946.1 hypothetical protein GCM10007390_30220 [Persicitalea jodogahamensis]